MAAVATLVGAACFILGRQAARAAAVAALDGGRDVEVMIWQRLPPRAVSRRKGDTPNVRTSVIHHC